MRYFVIAPDGQRYGPADLNMLNQWAAEGRLVPATLVQAELGGAVFAASLLPGIHFPLATAQGDPQPFSAYSHPVALDDGRKELQSAWIGSLLGLVLAFACGCGYPIALALFGVIMGLTAHKKGQRMAMWPIVIGVVAIAASLFVQIVLRYL